MTKRKAPPPDLRLVHDAVHGATDPPIDEPPGKGDGEPPRRAMPEGCPVEPLGTFDNYFYFLTALGELRALRARDIGNKDIVGMFAPRVEFLREAWPAKKLVTQTDQHGNLLYDAEGEPIKKWVVTGWRTSDVTELLMDVAADRGVWNARDKVRGRGAHRDAKGALILHCGNHLLIGGAWVKPGIYGGYVYPSAPAIPMPGPEDAVFTIVEDARERNVPVGLALLHWLKRWNWARPTIDPMLALGFIAIARLGGAIDWRPLAWITGGAGEGKSTLMGFIGDLFAGGMLKLESASEAAVRQLLGQDTLPVVLDETESEEDDRQMQALLKLARIAASGGNVGKGGADHQGVQFTARSCFLFSSILIPSLMPADKSRMAVLELRKLPPGARTPPIAEDGNAAERSAMAAAVTRRMVDQWGRWSATFSAFSDALIDIGGHRGRGAKVFATLLAAAHLLLDEDPPTPEELAAWAHDLAVGTLAELADSDGDDRRCIQHLATCLVQLGGAGTQRLVAEWVTEALTPTPANAVELVKDEFESRRRRAREALARVGLAITTVKRRWSAADEPRPERGGQYLAVANAHQGLARLFADSGWKSRAGASGVWAQSLKRIDGAFGTQRQRIGGILMTCTLVPLEAMFGALPEDGGDAPAGADAGVSEHV